jgi:hypothetical protein
MQRELAFVNSSFMVAQFIVSLKLGAKFGLAPLSAVLVFRLTFLPGYVFFA